MDIAIQETNLGTNHLKWVISLLVTAMLVGVFMLGWIVAHGHFYKSGDNVGYYLGLAGGLMMLVLLVYPMRKYFAFMRRWGQVKYWFIFHMCCGILGPTLVIFHSTFHMKSVNASVAFTCMVLVAGSGFIGRYAYTHVHRTMHGSKLTLEELQSDLFGRENEAESKLKNYPKVLLILHQYHHFAVKKNANSLSRVFRFFALPILRQYANMRCEAMLPIKSSRSRERRKLVLDYLNGVETYARFEDFERLFSLWHIVHVPLVYLLAGTSIWHVIAVHMY
jgi:hypothetical protein